MAADREYEPIPAFEGEDVRVARNYFKGYDLADRPLAHGEKVVLLVEATVSEIAFGTEKGDTIRKQRLQIENAVEATEELRPQVIESVRAAEDEREGRAQLPLGDMPDEDDELPSGEPASALDELADIPEPAEELAEVHTINGDSGDPEAEDAAVDSWDDDEWDDEASGAQS